MTKLDCFILKKLTFYLKKQSIFGTFDIKIDGTN